MLARRWRWAPHPRSRCASRSLRSAPGSPPRCPGHGPRRGAWSASPLASWLSRRSAWVSIEMLRRGPYGLCLGLHTCSVSCERRVGPIVIVDFLREYELEIQAGCLLLLSLSIKLCLSELEMGQLAVLNKNRVEDSQERVTEGSWCLGEILYRTPLSSCGWPGRQTGRNCWRHISVEW